MTLALVCTIPYRMTNSHSYPAFSIQFRPNSSCRTSDYRRLPRTLSHVYYDPLTPENRAEVEKIFQAFTSDPSDPLIHNRALETWGRKLNVPESTSNVAKFTFHELCAKPLSAADYLEITKTFGTIFVVDIPKMGLGEKDLVSIRWVCFRIFRSHDLYPGPSIYHIC